MAAIYGGEVLTIGKFLVSDDLLHHRPRLHNYKSPLAAVSVVII